MTMRHHTRRAVATTLALGLALSACSSDDGDTQTGGTTTTRASGATTAAGGEAVITVIGNDYNFEDLPATVPVGTRLVLQNDSDVELHELVAVRLPDDETRSVDALLQLPPEQLEAMMMSGEPAMVLIAPPGQASMAVVGDGTFTEPGRYVILCAIPVGADPEEYMAAAQASEGGPPQVAGGPPHFMEGMYAEVTVE